MAGRKRKEISKTQFEKLCAIQCTQEEISGVLGCTEKTLRKWCTETYKDTFKNVYKKLRLAGNASLRKSQWEMAKTNPTMSIWLGKQFLKQEENSTLTEIKLREIALKEKEFELKAKLIEAQLEEYLNGDLEDNTLKLEIVKSFEE